MSKEILFLIMFVAFTMALNLNENILTELSNNSEHVIDDGIELLKEFKKSLINLKETLITDSEKQKDILKTQISNLQISIEEKEIECQAFNDQIAYIKTAWAENKDLLQSLQTQIKKNNDLPFRIQSQRCQSQDVWILTAKSLTIIYQLIQTLKDKVINSQSLVELKQGMTELEEISSTLKTDISQNLDAIEYYMSKRKRNQSEENKDLLPEGKRQLLEILDQLEEQCTNDMRQAQINQATSSDRMYDFFALLEQENQVLKDTLLRFQKIFGDDVNQTIRKKEQDRQNCINEISKLQVSFNLLTSSEETLDNYLEIQSSKYEFFINNIQLEKINDQLSLLSEINLVYENNLFELVEKTKLSQIDQNEEERFKFLTYQYQRLSKTKEKIQLDLNKK